LNGSAAQTKRQHEMGGKGKAKKALASGGPRGKLSRGSAKETIEDCDWGKTLGP